MSAKNRPFTRLAAEMLGGKALTDLDDGKCPTCGSDKTKIDDFRDSLSIKEFAISGMCQSCQDSVFGE